MKPSRNTIGLLLLVGVIIGLFIRDIIRKRQINTIVVPDLPIATVTASSSVSNNSYTNTNSNTPITVVYNPVMIGNGSTLFDAFTMVGIEHDKHYDIKVIDPPLSTYDDVAIQLFTVADNTVRIVIINETGQNLNLPALTISALKTN